MTVSLWSRDTFREEHRSILLSCYCRSPLLARALCCDSPLKASSPRRGDLLWPCRFPLAVAKLLSIMVLVWQGSLGSLCIAVLSQLPHRPDERRTLGPSPSYESLHACTHTHHLDCEAADPLENLKNQSRRKIGQK